MKNVSVELMLDERLALVVGVSVAGYDQITSVEDIEINTVKLCNIYTNHTVDITHLSEQAGPLVLDYDQLALWVLEKI
jgi:hypothetical protein